MVVFSQSAAAVHFASAALARHGVGAVKILPGMPEAERRAAVARFTTDTAVRVFVLAVSQAAAGLTLTVASRIILLEPFLSPGDEAQAGALT